MSGALKLGTLRGESRSSPRVPPPELAMNTLKTVNTVYTVTLSPPPLTATPPGNAMIRLVHALDAARMLGPTAVPTLEPAVHDYVVACKARSMSQAAVLEALDRLVCMGDCHRGPGGAAGTLAAPIARWGSEAYDRAA